MKVPPPKIPSDLYEHHKLHEPHHIAFLVFGILFLQLAVAFGIAVIFICFSNVKNFLQDNSIISYIIATIFITAALALTFIPNVTEQFPRVLWYFILFTLLEGVFLGMIAATGDLPGLLLFPSTASAVTLILAFLTLITRMNYEKPTLLIFGWIVSMVVSAGATVLAILMIDDYDADANTILFGIFSAPFAFYFAFDVRRLVNDLESETELRELVGIALTVYLDVPNAISNLVEIMSE